MRVTITHTGAGRKFPFGTRYAGEAVEVPDAVGNQIIKQGFAIETKVMIEKQKAKAVTAQKEKIDG